MEDYKWKTAVITLSDKGYRGEREDKSGPLICEMLPEDSYSIEETLLLPDEQEMIEKELIRLCDDSHMDLILTTGEPDLPSGTVRRKLPCMWLRGMRRELPMPCATAPFKSLRAPC